MGFWLFPMWGRFQKSEAFMTVFNSFADLAQARINLADAREGITESYDGAFLEHSDLAKLNIIEASIAAEMPDPDMARRAVEMAIGTIFDVLKDTRMEEFAQQLAWGMVNSFHMTARLAEGREDDAAKKLGEMARHFDPSEIYAVELEETQQLCQTLQGCREALEAMRDHAADVYRVETGRPFTAARGSQVSKNGVTASQVQARDFLAARAKDRRAQFQPDGPLVIVSGGQKDWHDFAMIWAILDDIKSGSRTWSWARPACARASTPWRVHGRSRTGSTRSCSFPTSATATALRSCATRASSN